MEVVPPHVKISVLTFSTDVDEIEDVVRTLQPDVLHLELFPLQEFRKLHKRAPDLQMMPAIPVDGPDAIEQALAFQEVAESILLDTANSDRTSMGATGRIHDWNMSRGIVERLDVPVILAGGLNPENVGDAIRAVRPWGVDSFTLTSYPGDLRRKDLDEVRRFIHAAKETV